MLVKGATGHLAIIGFSWHLFGKEPQHMGTNAVLASKTQKNIFIMKLYLKLKLLHSKKCMSKHRQQNGNADKLGRLQTQ